MRFVSFVALLAIFICGTYADPLASIDVSSSKCGDVCTFTLTFSDSDSDIADPLFEDYEWVVIKCD